MQVKSSPFTVCAHRPLLAVDNTGTIVRIALKCTAERAACCGCTEWRDGWVVIQPDTLCPKKMNGLMCLHGERAVVVLHLEERDQPKRSARLSII
jgi:hypothetical protein